MAVGTRNGRRIGGVLVAVVALGAAVTACGGDPPDASMSVEAGDPSATPADVLARAADTSAAVQSGRIRVRSTSTTSLEGDAVTATVSAEGSFADGGRSSEMIVDMGNPLQALTGSMGSASGGADGATDAPGSAVVHTVRLGSTTYSRLDVGRPEHGTGQWYVIDDADLGLGASTSDAMPGMGGEPSSYVDALRGAGADVVDAGRTDIDGVAVTRYEGTIDPRLALDEVDPDRRDDLEGLLDQSGVSDPYPFTAYVDDDGVLRRLEMQVSAGKGLFSFSTTTVVDYYDLGADVQIVAPPADQVRPLSELTHIGG